MATPKPFAAWLSPVLLVGLAVVSSALNARNRPFVPPPPKESLTFNNGELTANYYLSDPLPKNENDLSPIMLGEPKPEEPPDIHPRSTLAVWDAGGKIVFSADVPPLEAIWISPDSNRIVAIGFPYATVYDLMVFDRGGRVTHLIDFRPTVFAIAGETETSESVVWLSPGEAGYHGIWRDNPEFEIIEDRSENEYLRLNDANLNERASDITEAELRTRLERDGSRPVPPWRVREKWLNHTSGKTTICLSKRSLPILVSSRYAIGDEVIMHFWSQGDAGILLRKPHRYVGRITDLDTFTGRARLEILSTHPSGGASGRSPEDSPPERTGEIVVKAIHDLRPLESDTEPD